MLAALAPVVTQVMAVVMVELLTMAVAGLVDMLEMEALVLL